MNDIENHKQNFYKNKNDFELLCNEIRLENIKLNNKIENCEKEFVKKEKEYLKKKSEILKRLQYLEKNGRK